MRVADLNHGGARSDRPFVVFAVPSTTTVPGVGSFHHPPFLQRREAFRSLRAHLHLDPPVGSIRIQPRFELMVVILAVSEDRLQSRKLLRRDLREQLRSGCAVVDDSPP